MCLEKVYTAFEKCWFIVRKCGLLPRRVTSARKAAACMQDVCRCNKVPVYKDCISFLTKAPHGKQAAYCLEGLFKSSVTDRKVQLLRQAYQLGRNPLRMLVGLQDPYAVKTLLKCCAAFCSCVTTILQHPLVYVGCRLATSLATRTT